MRKLRVSVAAALFFLGAALPLPAQLRTSLDSATLASFRWRNIGPANMAGRVSDVVGIPSPSRTFFVAAAAGGIWKSTNGGVTFRPVFDLHFTSLKKRPSPRTVVWSGETSSKVRNASLTSNSKTPATSTDADRSSTRSSSGRDGSR